MLQRLRFGKRKGGDGDSVSNYSAASAKTRDGKGTLLVCVCVHVCVCVLNVLTFGLAHTPLYDEGVSHCVVCTFTMPIRLVFSYTLQME